LIGTASPARPDGEQVSVTLRPASAAPTWQVLRCNRAVAVAARTGRVASRKNAASRSPPLTWPGWQGARRSSGVIAVSVWARR
jgi:hypothetical protein